MSSVESLSTAGGCQLAERLGFNGAVATYKGVLTANLRNVCVVALDKSQFGHLPALSRFRDEFEKVLSANPEGIALAVDSGEEPGYIWAAYEYLKGVHLGNYIRDKGLPTPPDAVSVIASTTGALMGLHRIGVPHRIISPASIFIKEPGEVRLMHAGWAGLLLGVQQGPAHPCFMSNLPFLAPEVAAGGEGDFASDIYSLGANLYFLATGQPTMWADDPASLARSIATTPLNLDPVRDSMPWELADLLEEMLAFDPDERPLNLEALKERMDLLAEALSEAAEEQGNQIAVPEEPTSASSSLASTHQGIEPPDVEPEEFPVEDEPAPEFAAGGPEIEEEPQEPDSRMPATGYGDPQTDPETSRLFQMAQSARDESYRLSQSHPEIDAPAAPPAYVPPPLPAPIYSPPPPPTHASSSGGGVSRKTAIIAAAIILLVVVGAGWGTMVLVSSLGTTPPAQAAPANSDPRPRQAAPARERENYNGTVQNLRLMATAQRGYAEKYGVWIQHPSRLEEFALREGATTDGWGTQMEFRQRYVVSAGPDKKWDTPQSPSSDDIWINSETMEIGGWSP